jgi:hypothetical protein
LAVEIGRSLRSFFSLLLAHAVTEIAERESRLFVESDAWWKG